MSLSQRRFTIHDPDAAPLHWKIPVTYAAVGSNVKGSRLLEESARVPAPDGGGPLKFNAGSAGYYRVAYDEATLRPLLGRINDLSAPDQDNLLSDAWAAVQANLGPVTSYLGIVKALRPVETHPLVWTQVCGVARSIDRLYIGPLYIGGDPAARTVWRKAMIAVLRPVLDHCGWEPAAMETPPVKELRATLIETLGIFDDAPTVAACKQRFAAFLRDPAALPPDIRPAVCDVAGHHADTSTYDALLAQARKATSDEQKHIFYDALSCATDPVLAQRTLDLTATDEVQGEDLEALTRGVARWGEQPDAAIKFVLGHLDKILPKVSPMAKNMVVPAAYASFTDAPRAEELENYARQPGAVADPTEVKKYAEAIRTNADLKARLLPEVNRWAADNK